MSDEMRVDPARAQQLSANLAAVKAGIRGAAAAAGSSSPVRLVAVSKLKPANDVLALYNSDKHLHFGENYQQELLAKSQLLPLEIKWHFIGGLQTNKCKPLAEQIPNLWCVESVDSAKKADQLEKGRDLLTSKHPETRGTPLRVFVQVNTSGEAEKSGVEPADAAGLCRHIRQSCPHLHLQGLMTIGAIARSRACAPGEENEDFATLRKVRDDVAGELSCSPQELELSMGMSNDYESAIRCGSNQVRVGTTVFGDRPAKQDAKLTDREAQ